MISYNEACQIVFSAKKFGICLGLERMTLLLEELGNPEKQIPTIHLAGTNGKGSTLTYIASILQEAGYNVGTYTSPALHKLNDKIKYNGEEISDDDFANIIAQLQPIIEKISQTSYGPPTEFEILTAAAFQYFATMKRPDIAIIETGLGGRLDSTNVVTPLVSIITNIGHDHQDLLGNTIREVAIEKAGIIKNHVPVVSGCKQLEAIEVMKQCSQERSASFYQLGVNFNCEHDHETFSYHWENCHLINLKAGMLGKHQQENATLAIIALQILPNFSISETAIRNGLAKAKIANRIEVIQHDPTLILDGGHNPEGMSALTETLKASYPNKKIYVLFCAMKDKDINAMLQPLKEVATDIIFTSFPFERVMDPQQVYKASSLPNSRVIENVSEAYNFIEQKLSPDDIFVITGSLYFLDYVRTCLEKKELSRHKVPN